MTDQARRARQALDAHVTGEFCRDREFFVVIDLDSDEKKTPRI